MNWWFKVDDDSYQCSSRQRGALGFRGSSFVDSEAPRDQGFVESEASRDQKFVESVAPYCHESDESMRLVADESQIVRSDEAN